MKKLYISPVVKIAKSELFLESVTLSINTVPLCNAYGAAKKRDDDFEDDFYDDSFWSQEY